MSTHIKQTIGKIFSFDNLQQQAVRTGFYKRSSKVLPSVIFDALMQSASTNDQVSLRQIHNDIQKEHHITVSRQAINERIDQSCEAFMQAILEQVLQAQITEPVDKQFLSGFEQVRIKDSTKFDLPERLQKEFPGFGGKRTSKAGTSIQYEFDLKNWKFISFNIATIKRTDHTEAKETINDINKGDLIIRDLGYFSFPVIKEIEHKGAYYVSRLKSNIEVYDQHCQKIDFDLLYSQMQKQGCTSIEMQVFIGKGHLLPTRLVVSLIPDNVYEKRMRKRGQENKKRGQQTSLQFKSMARFSLFITNIETNKIPLQDIIKLYKMRWQIELLFKTWKTQLGFNNIHAIKYNRFMCLIYAKLILYISSTQLVMCFKRKYWHQKKKILSMQKSFNTILINYFDMRKCLILRQIKIYKYLMEKDLLLSKYHWLEGKKDKDGFDQLFDLFICKSAQ